MATISTGGSPDARRRWQALVAAVRSECWGHGHEPGGYLRPFLTEDEKTLTISLLKPDGERWRHACSRADLGREPGLVAAEIYAEYLRGL